jgi:hypothetical protein
MRRATASAALLSALALGRGADAQEAHAEAARRVLVAQAQRAADDGDHARAVELLTRAAQVRTSPSLRQFLVDELLETRAWLRAYVEAVQCQREATADATLPYRREILRDCVRAEARARPHLAQLVVNAPEDAPTLRVRAAGADVPRAFWGVQFPVASGAVVLDANTDDGRTFRAELTLGEGETRTVTVVLSPAATRTVVTPPPPPLPPTPPPSLPPPPPRPLVFVAPTPSSRPMRTAAWVSVGIGAAGAVTGAIAMGLLSVRAEEFNAMTTCGEAEPSRGAPGCAEAYDRTVTTRAAFVTGWVIAGVGVVAGAVLHAVASRSARVATAPPAWWIAVTPEAPGAAFGATF